MNGSALQQAALIYQALATNKGKCGKLNVTRSAKGTQARRRNKLLDRCGSRAYLIFVHFFTNTTFGSIFLIYYHNSNYLIDNNIWYPLSRLGLELLVTHHRTGPGIILPERGFLTSTDSILPACQSAILTVWQDARMTIWQYGSLLPERGVSGEHWYWSRRFLLLTLWHFHHIFFYNLLQFKS